MTRFPRRTTASAPALAAVVALAAVGCTRVSEPTFFSMVRQTPTEGRLRVYFLHLFGDAILIELPSEKYVLVDGALRARLPWLRNRLLRRLDKLGVRSWNLEAVVLTHPHADHYAGLESAVDSYAPKRFYHTGLESLSGRYKDFIDLVRRQGCEMKRLRRGDEVDFGDDVKLKVLWPPADAKCSYSSYQTNALSLVARLSHNKVSILLAGDLKRDAEQDLIELCAEETEGGPSGLEAHILKVAHHGSRTSSSKTFLDRVGPKAAVILGDQFNLESGAVAVASPQTVRRLEESDISVLRTSKMGTVMIETDGEVVRRLATPLHVDFLDDADGDGIDDGAEMLVYGTDRWSADTDGDGIVDREELAVRKTDPNVLTIQPWYSQAACSGTQAAHGRKAEAGLFR
ncbi:MAG: MBL fold metallo-hydrolase [Planctomycetota bacterium]